MDRDRIAVHLAWEAVLAIVTAALIGGTIALTHQQNVTNALQTAGYLGLIATGLAFSLRTGAPNLAVGSMTGFAAALAAHLRVVDGWGKPAALAAAVVATAFIGLILGVLTGLLSVPGWAVTLAAATGLQAGTLQMLNNGSLSMPFTGGYPTALWLAVFLVLSVGGGLLWLVPGLRQQLSAVRRPSEPGRWAGLPGLIGPVVGLTGSSLLAGLAAIPLLMRLQVADPNIAGNLTILALAAALLGGVSIFGRRAGIFGTALAVLILALTQMLIAYNGISVWVLYLVLSIAAVVGLVVSRALESVTEALNT